MGLVYKFTPTGVRTTFASGLNYPFALAFDSRGNLFVADGGYDGFDFPVLGAAVYKFTPSGLRSTVASENDQVSVIPYGLAIDSADNLFVADQVSATFLSLFWVECEGSLSRARPIRPRLRKAKPSSAN